MRALRLLCVTVPIAVITALVNLPTKGFWSWVIAIVIATGVIAMTDSGRRWPWTRSGR